MTSFKCVNLLFITSIFAKFSDDIKNKINETIYLENDKLKWNIIWKIIGITSLGIILHIKAGNRIWKCNSSVKEIGYQLYNSNVGMIFSIITSIKMYPRSINFEISFLFLNLNLQIQTSGTKINQQMLNGQPR